MMIRLRKIRVRLSHNHGASDLHAPDARYHNGSRLDFMGGNIIYYMQQRKHIQLKLKKINQGYEKVRKLLVKTFKILEDVVFQDQC